MRAEVSERAASPHLEVLVAEESVHDPEAQDVGHLGVPLDDDRVLLPVGVLHDDLWEDTRVSIEEVMEMTG